MVFTHHCKFSLIHSLPSTSDLISLHYSLFIEHSQYFDYVLAYYNRGEHMIDYSPFFQTLKIKNESTYTMIHKYNLSSSLINRLRNNKPISTTTLNDLCRILNCKVDDILVYIPSDDDPIL